jgi:hypothetical protein
MFKYLTLDEAEAFVASHKNWKWDGWDMQKWVPNPSAFTKKNGRFNPNHRAKWGTITTVSPDAKGLYRVKS